MSGSDPIRGRQPVLVNLSLTHKNAEITLLEAAFFPEIPDALNDMLAQKGVEECFILQTCNRVELFALTYGEDSIPGLLQWWRTNLAGMEDEFDEAVESSASRDALLHLLRLSAGLESMVVGEDQILGQLQKSCAEARDCGAVGPLLDLIMFKVLTSGRAIRKATGINRGAVSIGTVAVNLVEESLGNLDGRPVGIVGAGETATLVGKYLIHEKRPELFVSNRTQRRGEALAKLLGGRAVPLKAVSKLLSTVDAIFVATSAPQPVITREIIEAATGARSGREIFVVDLSQPRNVEESVGLVPGVTLYNIDDLRRVSQRNLDARLEAAKATEALILVELESLEAILRREMVEPVVSAIWSSADEIRSRELERALEKMEGINADQRTTIEKLSRVLVTRLLHNPIEALRDAAVNENFETIRTAEALFKVNQRGRNVD
ncbi:MAG: glutamyl-tRNA reductase [Candidatus Bathyarchaeia archaeon]